MTHGATLAGVLLMLLLVSSGRVVLGDNCTLTPHSARANHCDGGGCQCWCTPQEGAYTIWQWVPTTAGGATGGPDICCYDPGSDPPCFAAAPLVSNTLGSHMVLQAAPQKASVFGWASPEDNITVMLRAAATSVHGTDQIHVSTPGPDGEWAVQLDPVMAGGPYNITVSSLRLRDSIILVDVLFGELWMCGGQSNMELTVSQAFNASAETADGANFPNIRLFTVGQEYADASREYKQLRTVWQDWSVASPQALGAGNWTVFSAACWFFGRELHKHLGVPVGLVSNNWGGTSIQTWMSADAVAKCPTPSAPEQDFLSAPPPMLRQRPMPHEPSVLWSTMVAPFTRQTFRGVIFYQGESDARRGDNAGAAAYYACAVQALVTDWRARFATPNLAFHSTLLAPIDTLWGFAGIRMGQQAVLNLSNAGVASAADTGDPHGPWQGTLHPRDKQIVGTRLSLVARALTYGESATTTHEGPRVSNVSIAFKPNRINVSVVATVSFAAGSLGVGSSPRPGVVLRAPSLGTQQTCGAGLIPNLCGYIDFVYATPRDASLQTTRATLALTENQQQLVLTASVPANATVLRLEAYNNEWPVISVYNTAGLPMFPFIHVITLVPPRLPFCPENNQTPCRDAAEPSTAVPCDGDYKFVSECVLSGTIPRYVDAVYVRCNLVTAGGSARGLIYNSTSDGEAPMSLLASSAAVILPSANASWVRFQLASPVQIVPGRYWVGWLLENRQDCFSGNPNAASGARSHEFCSANKWINGPSAVWGNASPGGGVIDVFATYADK